MRAHNQVMLAQRIAPSGGGSFVPTDLAGLKVYYNASLMSNADGDLISSFTDYSGNANHGTASGTQRPTYKTGITANGKQVVRLDASAQLQFFDIPNVLSALTAGTIFILTRIVNDPPATTNKSGLWQLGSFASDSHYPWTDGGIYDGAGSTTRQTVGNPTPSLSSVFRTYTVKTASGNWTAYLDGTQLFTTGTNTVGFTTTPKLGKTITGYYMDADIAAFLIYDSALSDTDRGKVETYLAGLA